MKHVSLDKEDERIKDFVRSLLRTPDGSILELEGKPIVKVLPWVEEKVDPAKVKAAILKRREESRTLNKDWEAVDQEMWNRISATGE